jgi:hypothetical protein
VRYFVRSGFTQMVAIGGIGIGGISLSFGLVNIILQQ